MANHVYNRITLENGNDAVLLEWQRLFMDYGEHVERDSYHGDGTIKIWEFAEIQKHPFMSGYDEDNWYNWGCENIGAKWAHIDDATEYDASITSAWSPVMPYVEELYKHLTKFDSTVVIRHTYEDEFRNFIGVSITDSDGNSFDEIDSDELQQILKEQYPTVEDDDFDWEYHEETDTCPNEWYDDFCYNWLEHGGV